MKTENNTSSTDQLVISIVAMAIVFGLYWYFSSNYPEMTEILINHFIYGVFVLGFPFLFVLNFFSYKRKAYKELVYYKIKDNIFLIATISFVAVFAYVFLTYSDFSLFVLLDHFNFYLMIVPLAMTYFVYNKFFTKVNKLKIVAQKIMAIPAITNIEKMINFKPRKKIETSFFKTTEAVDYTILTDKQSKVIEIPNSFIFTEKKPIWTLNKGNGKKELNAHFVNKEIENYKPIILKKYEDILTDEKLKPYYILIDYVTDKLKTVKRNPDINKLLKKYNYNLEFVILHLFDVARNEYMFDTYYGQCYVYAKNNLKFRKLLCALDNVLMNDIQFTGIEIFHLYMIEKNTSIKI